MFLFFKRYNLLFIKFLYLLTILITVNTFCLNSYAETQSSITVLGAVKHQQTVDVPEEEIQQPLAHLLSFLIGQSEGFTDFAETDKLYVYFTLPTHIQKNKQKFTYNNECQFRFNTPKPQDDKDCLLVQEHPELIYRVFVEGSKRRSRWTAVKEALSLTGSIAVPVILSTQSN